MQIRKQIGQWVDRIRNAPADELTRSKRFIRFQMQLWRFCFKRLGEHNAGAMAAALSFRTIFAIVPVLVLALLVANNFPWVDSSEYVRDFLERSGFAQIRIVQESDGDGEGEWQAVGTTTATATAAATATATAKLDVPKDAARPAPPADDMVINVAEEIENLVEMVEQKLKEGQVGPIGVVLLIWTAVALLSTMEVSLNTIFGATRSRPIWKRMLVYWSVLTLVPIVIAAAVYMVNNVLDAFVAIPLFAWFSAIASTTVQIVVGVAMLAVVYKMLPNTHIAYRSAISGAMIAYPLYMIAMWLFARYVDFVVTQNSLYGALGLLPLFLAWLFLIWMIFLFGAELAHTATNLSAMEARELAEKIRIGPREMAAAALAVAISYRKGEGFVYAEDMAKRLRLPEETVCELLRRLENLGIVVQLEDDEDEEKFILARPAEQVSLLTLTDIRPREGESHVDPKDAEIEDALDCFHQWAEGRLTNASLADLVEQRLTATPDQRPGQ